MKRYSGKKERVKFILKDEYQLASFDEMSAWFATYIMPDDVDESTNDWNRKVTEQLLQHEKDSTSIVRLEDMIKQYDEDILNKNLKNPKTKK